MIAGEELAPLRRCADAVDLFLFSAALWVPHRIHYDQRWCQGEGYPSLLVHGPLQGTWLLQMVQRWAAAQGGEVVRLRYRNRRPLVAGENVICRGVVSEVEGDGDHGRAVVEVWVEREADGERTTVGSAEVRRR